MSKPSTAPDWTMSSPLPCGTPSMTSTRTTSASSFSTILWATVAPTFPAPITVTLRRMTSLLPCTSGSKRRVQRGSLAPGLRRRRPCKRTRMGMVSGYKNLPTWKRGMSFAHTVYAAVEAAGAKGTEAGTRLRKAAVSVPSLVGEAFLDLPGSDVEEALGLAETKLAEVARLLTSEPALDGIPAADRESLLSDLSALRAELAQLREEASGERTH